MKKTTIRGLRNDRAAVRAWVARIARPDFLARLRTIYGDKVLSTTATDLISESRGET